MGTIVVLQLEQSDVEFTHTSAAGTYAALCYPRLISVGTIRQLASAGEHEAPSTTVQLDNGDAGLSWIFSSSMVVPLRAAVTIYHDGLQVFDGLVSRVEYGPVITMSVEGGSKWLLNDELPLRDTSVWGAFRRSEKIPHVYGSRVRLSPIQYSEDRVQWVVADHSLSGPGVREVYRDDGLTTAWSQQATQDKTGHAIHVLTLATPLARGEELRVICDGKAHPDTGVLIENPATIIWDVLKNITGLILDEDRLGIFWEETSRAGIALSGVLNWSGSIRSAVSEILESVGAIWSTVMPGLASMWPAQRDAAYKAELGNVSSELSGYSASGSNLATEVLVRYHYDWAFKDFRGALLLSDPDAIIRYGTVRKTVDAKWVQTRSLAYSLGERILRAYSAPRWTGGFSVNLSNQLDPGDWVNVTHGHAPSTGAARAVSTELDLARARRTLYVEHEPQNSSRVSIESLATAFEELPASGATAAYSDGDVIFTILDTDGMPEANARVTLDGSTTRTTDASGKCQFEASPGAHVLYVSPAEGDDYEIAINV